MCLQANAELSLIWVVGQHMWHRDYRSMYEALRKDWSESVRPIMTALSGNCLLYTSDAADES